MILRETYGPTNRIGECGIKTNSELLYKYKSKFILTVMKIRRIEWLGHVIRMNDTRFVKKFFEGKFRRKKRYWTT